MADTGRFMMGRVRHIHFVGIGGAGMSGIAEVLHNLGYQVSGSDINESPTVSHLKNLGIRVSLGHKAEHVDGSDIVVYSSAVTSDNAELDMAHRQRIPVVPRAQMLADLMRFHSGIAVAGTHGKTTTTSLVASLLAEAGLDPTYVIGGLLNSAGSHAKLGSGKYLVAEADESDASFHHLQPVIAVLTNIDRDHLESYGGDFQNLEENFSEFINRLPFYGIAVICMDDSGCREILPDIYKSFITYGIENEADYRAHDITYTGSRSEFRVLHDGEDDWIEINLNLPGNHNVLNALAAISVAAELGISKQYIKSGLENFEGIARRCDSLGEINVKGKTVLLIDDYAHHPAEIAAILSAVRTGWPGRRMVVVFQPHRFTRTRDLFDEFCDVLANVDVLVLLEIYSAGESPLEDITGTALFEAVSNKARVRPVFAEKVDDVIDTLPEILLDQDILLILGAGSIGSLAAELNNRFGARIH